MVLDVDPDFYNVVTCKFDFLRNQIALEFFWNPSIILLQSIPQKSAVCTFYFILLFHFLTFIVGLCQSVIFLKALYCIGIWYDIVVMSGKVEIFLEQREVAFLSPSKICENLNFSREIQIFANFSGW